MTVTKLCRNPAEIKEHIFVRCNSAPHFERFCTILEDSIYKNKFEKISNIVLSQYFKLKCAVEEVYKYEKENLILFKNFIKLRTDFYYYNSENLLDMRLENNQDCLS